MLACTRSLTKRDLRIVVDIRPARRRADNSSAPGGICAQPSGVFQSKRLHAPAACVFSSFVEDRAAHLVVAELGAFAHRLLGGVAD